MIISFRCPPIIKEQVDSLIAKELYPDFSAFCVAALENQLLLEDTHASPLAEGVSVVTQRRLQGALPPRELPKKSNKPRGPRRDLESSGAPVSSAFLLREDEGEAATESHQMEPVVCSLISPDLALARISGEPPFSLPSTFADVFHGSDQIPPDRWMFGQYNRLLPAKVSIRALAAVSTEGKDALLLGAVAPRIAEVAAKLGDHLRSLDRRFANHRDDALATAFPDGSIEGQKGRVRYQNHFVGHTVKGEQGGMLVDVKLAVIHVIKNKPHILPTVAGWDFARLINPLLDVPVSETVSRFSGEEVAFLLRHIREHVPVELFAYRVMLSLISEGKSTPELVNQGLAKYLSPGKKIEDEQDFLSTQRNGVLGRMADLGLVSRERQGKRISYHLTTAGEKFLDEVGPIHVGA